MQKKLFLIIVVVILSITALFTIFKIAINNKNDSSSAISNEQSKQEVVQKKTDSDKEDSTSQHKAPKSVSIVFLHHSTGQAIWDGGVAEYFSDHNAKNNTDYEISEMEFPSVDYGCEYYPYYYWNIWVKHGKEETYKGQPTLLSLTQQYDVIIFKHCFPVGNIEGGWENGDITDSTKTLGNYRAQYEALKKELHSYPNNIFIVWTGAALVRDATDPTFAQRQKEFVDWVKNDWDQPNDNIFVFDFYALETEGSLYMQPQYSESSEDSHPNSDFSKKVAPIFAQFIIDTIQQNL
jgi:hypothetical protein